MNHSHPLEGFTDEEKSSLLVLSLCNHPVSLDRLIEWEFAKPVDLWRLLEECRKRSLIRESSDDKRGYFEWVDRSVRDELLLEASIDTWRSVLVHKEIIKLAIELLHETILRKDRKSMLSLFRALVNGRFPDRYPEGELGFMRVVFESCRYFIDGEWRPYGVVERALEISRHTGDKLAEALFLGQMGHSHIHSHVPSHNLETGWKLLEQSRDIVRTLGNPELEFAAGVAFAVNLVWRGKLRESISYFEDSLGDVPQDVIPVVERMFIDDALASTQVLGILALAYSAVGQPTTAVDLLHRTISMGTRTNREEVAKLAWLYLALIYAAYGEMKPARQGARAALEYWQSYEIHPQFVWLAAVLVARLCMEEGNADEAARALRIGHEARTRAQFPYFFSKALLEVLEWLEIEGVTPVEGITFQGEIDRILNWSDIRMKGVAHLFAFRRLLRSNAPGDIDQHLLLSEQLLREAGALPDLMRTLEARADREKSHERHDRAQTILNEAHQISRIVPPLISLEHTSDVSVEHLALHILELGRLSTLAGKKGLWGELASRLCAQLGTERCVIIELGPPPRILALRGGSTKWADAVIQQLASRSCREVLRLKPPTNEEDEEDQGELLVIPFSSPSLNRSGVVGLENRRTKPMIRSENVSLLEALGAQVSILFENANLCQELHDIQGRLERENRYYKQNGDVAGGAQHILGSAPATMQMMALVTKVAPTDTAVLVTGETGVGKELVAREIHRLSPRSEGPFIVVHIAAMAPGLVASGLFGHERGAFTGAVEQVRGRFELADKGTLFLDEIGELGSEEQARLLRVLQEGTFERVGGTKPLRSDFRLIAATNRDLRTEVKTGRFREDLFYRLNVFPIHVPPLRERVEDIPLLALFFMEQSAKRLGHHYEGISELDMDRIMSYSWPGNVRELMHHIERAAVLSDGPKLRIPPLVPTDSPDSSRFVPDSGKLTTLAEVERRYIRQVLQRTQGRVTGKAGAAEILGLKPSTLNFRIRKLGLVKDMNQARKK